ncbi:MAG: TldD/PmbA family protein [Candidatus Symbiothrix sp.]|jgi:predicted Zn-dependent protease|nr:TldD/PmbA family protein [Candidatus Symbiothrix sp.]
MNKRLILFQLFLLVGMVTCVAQDAVFNTIKTELQRNFAVLKDQPIPSYYTFIRLDDLQMISAGANLGCLQSEAVLGSPSRILTTGMRVGDYHLDNSHEIRESGGSSGMNVTGNYLPYEANDRTLRNAIWSNLDQLYKESIQTYEQVKANLAVKVEQEDKSPDFSEEKVENYYEQAIDWNSLGIDPKAWEEKVRRYSKVFDENDEIQNGSAYISASLSRILFIDTEGREMAQNTVKFQLFLTANTVADDGMYLPLYRSWMSHSIGELPSDEEVLAAAREISATLSALRKAPVVESFTGPAILSPAASGVFFHEIFGHRVEGARLKQENDAQTFKKKVGESVLPKHLSVTFDPTINYYQTTSLMGNYHFDDEGIISQRVEVVKNGILKNFLMSRTPIEGFLHSNGHGRGNIGNAPVSRQSNMFVETTKGLSEDELFKQLRKEAKSQGKKYAYYFKEVSGGFTNTNRYSPNSFNVTPLVVYRIYVDGRPDELVRGVDMVGTPLAMFSQIAACGDKSTVFNGICGAESGSVPVSCVAPAMLVKRIETQKKPKSQSQPILLPKPQEETSNTNLSDEKVIFEAIKKEVDRNLEQLKMDNLQRPFFIAYTISDVKKMDVAATFGSLISSVTERGRSGGSRLLIGDYQCTDENFQGTAGGGSGFDGSPTLDNNEKIIRNTIWKDLDAIYKRAAETYEQKTATIKQLNIPAKDLELPDWDKTPIVKMTDLPMKTIDFTPSRYEDYVKKVSAVFKDYPEILDSQFSIQLMQAKAYFYNTEGSEIIYPLTYAYLNGGVSGKNAEGEDLSDSFNHIYSTPEEFPSIEQMQEECRQLAKNLIEEIHATKMTDSYSGPVLFEQLAVSDLFYNNFFGGDLSLIANRKPLTTEGFSYGGNGIEEMMNKRITAREITIEDLTGTPEYQGVKLLGYAPVDAQGVVPPAKLTIVEKGLLVNLLSDRVPSPKTPHSNGHALFTIGLSSNLNTGVIRLADTRTKAYSEMKKELLERAKEEGYEYAYIVREMAGSSYPSKLYQVNVADGSEKRIRSAELNNMDSQIFKKIINVSDKELIYNTVSGNLITIITPNAILFDDMQIQSDRVDNFQKAPLVPAPEIEKNGTSLVNPNNL